MTQPQRRRSEKFADLHTAFLGDGAFVYVPRGVELSEPIIISHLATGGAVFPDTLVVLEENAKATVVDLFAGETPFALGANDLFGGHGSQLTYVGVQNWSPNALSFQLNSTVSRRDT